MWRDYIKGLTDTYEFKQAVSEDEIKVVEDLLDVKLHDDLKNLLKEANGVRGEYGLGLIWSLERIKDENLSFRENEDFKELYMPFDSLLFFADAGNGDQFAYPIVNNNICKDDIFVWNHENDSRTWVASSLRMYLKWWLDGTMKI